MRHPKPPVVDPEVERKKRELWLYKQRCERNWREHRRPVCFKCNDLGVIYAQKIKPDEAFNYEYTFSCECRLAEEFSFPKWSSEIAKTFTRK